jgi:hypothetical protein
MEKKVCSKCGVEKFVNEFNTRKNRKGLVVPRGFCKKCHCKISVEFNKVNPNKNKEYRTKWYQKNSKKLIDGNKKRRNTDLLYKLKIGLRTRMKFALKHNYKRGKTVDLLGIDILSLKTYLESKFLDNMSWDNYGLNGWHIDHIIPLSSAQNEEEFKKLCHYTNLQPLWAKDNFKKGSRIII